MPDTFSMADQFKGLPMGDLIGGPLQAACDAQVRLALSTANFIQQIGFMPPQRAAGDTDATKDLAPTEVRTVSFKFDRPAALQPPAAADGTSVTRMETVDLTVPLLAIVRVPSLSISTVDITFDMEVKNTERSVHTDDTKGAFSADASVGWGPFSLKVHVEGSVASHQENTRETDQSAKYHVAVHAEDKGMPEGLSRVLDMMMQAIAPKAVTPKAADAPTSGDTGAGGGAPAGVDGPKNDLRIPAPPASGDQLDHAQSQFATREPERTAKPSGGVRGTFYEDR